MQSEAHFHQKSPGSMQYHSLLPSAQSLNQLSPSVAKLPVAPKKKKLMSITIKQEGHMGDKYNQMADVPTLKNVSALQPT